MRHLRFENVNSEAILQDIMNNLEAELNKL